MVCEWFDLKTTRTVFTGLASKPVATVSGGLASKPVATVSGALASKPAATVFIGFVSKSVATVFSSLASKLVVTTFSSLASKLVAMVSPDLTSKSAVGFFVEPQNPGSRGFSSLVLKTGSSDLVICASKLPRWFLDLGLKIKCASICRLRHKTDGVMSTRDTCRDLAACFAWKQVWLGFISLT
jgi:hypothetical protein